MATPETTAENAAKAVDDKIAASRESFGDRMGKVKEKVGEVAEGVKAKATEWREKIRETEWSDVTQKATDYVKENPGKSVAAALLLGFAVGFLVRRRGDD